MRISSRDVKAFLCSILSFAMFVSSTSVVLAQTVDVVAPVIEHTAVTSATAGEDVLVEAEVTDNVSVNSVILFYRFEKGVDFNAIPMSSSGDATYFASIPTDADLETELQYYIEAVDGGGTKVTRGLAFDPIIVPVEKNQQKSAPAVAESEPEIIETPASTTTPVESADSSSAPAPAPARNNNRLWYALGGVLVLGLIAGAAGGGGGNGGGASNQECVNGTCQVTFNLTAP